MKRVCWRGGKPELGVPPTCVFIDCVHEHGADSNQLTGLQNSSHRVLQQGASQMLALTALVNRKTTEQNDGHRLAGGKATGDSSRRLLWHHSTGGERVVAGDLVTARCRDEHARSSAAVAL